MIELRQHQKDGLDFLMERGSGALIFDTGLGKSRTSLAAVYEWESLDNLIVCPKVVGYHWRREILKVLSKWVEDRAIFIALGTSKDKEEAIMAYSRYRLANPKSPRFLITNYQTLSTIGNHKVPSVNEETGRVVVRPIRWSTRILDECQFVKNHQTKLFRSCKRVKADHHILLTATPTSQGPKDLWAYLNIMDGVNYGSYWTFVDENLWVNRNTNRGTVIGGARKPKLLQEQLRPYFLRRRKKDMGPVKTRDLIEVDMLPKQEKVYKEMKEESILIADDGDLVLSPNGATNTLRLRQILVSPKLLGIDIPSATLEAVEDLVKSINGPVVIFTPFREAFGLIESVLPKSCQPAYKISGGMTSEALDDMVQQFEESKQEHKVLIATVQLSQGYEILTANHAIFAGMDWSNITHLQAEGRLDRLTKTEPVTFYYIINRNTVEENVMETVDQKIRWDTENLAAN